MAVVMVLVGVDMQSNGQRQFSRMMDQVRSGDGQQHEQREERPEGAQAPSYALAPLPEATPAETPRERYHSCAASQNALYLPKKICCYYVKSLTHLFSMSKRPPHLAASILPTSAYPWSVLI